MANILQEALEGASRVLILGHVHPDGDCVGSTLGLYNYLRDNCPALCVDIYLDHPGSQFAYLRYFDQVRTDPELSVCYDLCISLDASDHERLGQFAEMFDRAKDTLCLDHHRTNPGFARKNLVRGDASSSCEVLYELLEEAKIGRDTAACLYTGIIHDTGVFKYQATSRRTMDIAGALMEKGIDFTGMVDNGFYRRTFAQNKVMGLALMKSRLVLDGLVVISQISANNMEDCGAGTGDLDGIVEQLRLTEGVECAVFLYESGEKLWKVSLRSKEWLDVSRVAQSFQGGGHVRAAGCSLSGDAEEVQVTILAALASEIEKHEEEGVRG